MYLRHVMSPVLWRGFMWAQEKTKTFFTLSAYFYLSPDDEGDGFQFFRKWSEVRRTWTPEYWRSCRGPPCPPGLSQSSWSCHPPVSLVILSHPGSMNLCNVKRDSLQTLNRVFVGEWMLFTTSEWKFPSFSLWGIHELFSVYIVSFLQVAL